MSGFLLTLTATVISSYTKRIQERKRAKRSRFRSVPDRTAENEDMSSERLEPAVRWQKPCVEGSEREAIRQLR